MNQYQRAIDTKRIALNDIGLLAWVKHNQDTIMKSLAICASLKDQRNHVIPPIYDRAVDVPAVGFLETWVDE